jgi:type I restriction enzyme S subunit
LAPKVVSLDEACALVTDGTHYTPTDVGSGIPFLTVKDMAAGSLDFTGCAFITDTDFQAARAGNSAPVAGDVLFSKDGTVGKVHVVSTDQPFAVLSSIAILRPSRDVDPGYLAHALRSPSVLAEAVRNKTGSAIRRIVLADLKRLKVPLPPLAEQRRIAAILDRTDALRVKRRAALARLEAVDGAMFSHLFGSLITNDRAWPTDVLSRVCDETNDCPHTTPKWATSGVVCLRTSNLTAGGWNWRDKRFVTAADYHLRSKRGYLEPGDIVLSREGTVGIAAIVPHGVPMCMGQRLVQVRPSLATVLPQYLLRYLLDVLAPDRIARTMAGSTSKHLNLKDLRALRIPLPPLSDQQLYSGMANHLSLIRAAHTASLSRLDALFASLQRAAFRGEL